MLNQTFPGFDYPANELSEYIYNNEDVFIIAHVYMKNILFTSPDPDAFRKWLHSHGIKDITSEAGSLVTDYYFKNEK